jgi:hypothetical protein
MAAFRQQSDYGIAGLAYIRQMQTTAAPPLIWLSGPRRRDSLR